MLTIPNMMTLARIVLIPLFLILFLLPFPNHYMYAAGVFLLACLTDMLDGFLARCMGQETEFGRFLDPVADKLIVVTALFLIVYRQQELLLLLPALIIVGREITVSALREWTAGKGVSDKMKVSWYGKVKTTAQMVSICLLIYHPQFWIYMLGLTLLYIAAGLTLWSMFLYLRAAWPVIYVR